MRKRDSLKRRCGERRYRRIFVIATEGVKTEPQYFRLFNMYDSVVRVKCLSRDHKSSPAQSIRRAKEMDNPRCADWPRNVGTTVYRLVESILATTG